MKVKVIDGDTFDVDIDRNGLFSNPEAGQAALRWYSGIVWIKQERTITFFFL